MFYFYVNVDFDQAFKTRDQFKTIDEYSRYVSDNISVGLSVRCIENCDEVRKGDTGRVTKVSQYVSTKQTLHSVKQEVTHPRTNKPLWPGLTLFHHFMIIKFDIRERILTNLMMYLYQCLLLCTYLPMSLLNGYV